MADEWITNFSIEDDGFAYASVTHDGEVQTCRLGPAGTVVAAAMGWVEYHDVRCAVTEDMFRAMADFFTYERDRPDLAAELTSAADELYGATGDVPQGGVYM